jgi:hypothetical protein
MTIGEKLATIDKLYREIRVELDACIEKEFHARFDSSKELSIRWSMEAGQGTELWVYVYNVPKADEKAIHDFFYDVMPGLVPGDPEENFSFSVFCKEETKAEYDKKYNHIFI